MPPVTFRIRTPPRVPRTSGRARRIPIGQVRLLARQGDGWSCCRGQARVQACHLSVDAEAGEACIHEQFFHLLRVVAHPLQIGREKIQRFMRRGLMRTCSGPACSDTEPLAPFAKLVTRDAGRMCRRVDRTALIDELLQFSACHPFTSSLSFDVTSWPPISLRATGGSPAVGVEAIHLTSGWRSVKMASQARISASMASAGILGGGFSALPEAAFRAAGALDLDAMRVESPPDGPRPRWRPSRRALPCPREARSPSLRLVVECCEPTWSTLGRYKSGE